MNIDKRNADRIKAEELYIESKGKIELVNIAETINRPAGTVRGWKSKDKWDAKLNGTFQNKVERSNLTNSKKKESKIIDKEIVEQVVKNELLTDEQQLFCIYYIRCFNATKAYQKAYQCDYISAMSNSSRLIRNDKIRNQIQSLKQKKLNRALLSEDDIFQKYMDIAFADITDYVEFGTEKLPELNIVTGEQAIDKEGNPLFYTRNYVNFKNATEVDGTLLSEVKQGKDGVSVKLQDKMKALQWLSDRMDLIPTLSKERLEIEKSKVDKISDSENKVADMLEKWIESDVD